MNRAEFESKLSDYVRGELSSAEARQIETYSDRASRSGRRLGGRAYRAGAEC